MTAKKKKKWGQLKSQFNCLSLKIRTGNNSVYYFYPLDSGHSKADKPLEVKGKKRKRYGTWTKKDGKSHFGYKLHSIIDRDYELIRRFKTTAA